MPFRTGVVRRAVIPVILLLRVLPRDGRERHVTVTYRLNLQKLDSVEMGYEEGERRVVGV